jgi:hypothetical protein
MKGISIKFVLLRALFSCCLAGIAAGPALARLDGGCGENSGALIQTLDDKPAQERQEPLPIKRKPLHEYGPEDLIPEARDPEPARPRRNQPQSMKADAGDAMPSSRPLPPAPAPVPAVTPKPAPTPVTMATPAAVGPVAPAISTSPPTPPNLNLAAKPTASRRMFYAYSISFVVVLLVLIVVMIKTRRLLRATAPRKTEHASTQPAVETQPVQAAAQASVQKRLKRSGKSRRGVKNRMPRARHTGAERA